MSRKKSDNGDGAAAAVETAVDSSAAEISAANIDAVVMDRLEKARETRRRNAAAGIVPVRPSYLVIGGKADGSQQVLAVLPTRHQCQRWLDNTGLLLAANYASVAIFRGKLATEDFNR